MPNCLVIGANGLIGSGIVDALSKSNNNVVAFDRYTDQKIQFNQSDNVKIVKGDFLKLEDLKKSLKNIDYVFHFISTTNPIISENNPTLDVETNILMTVRLMELCVKNNVKRVIFPSSGGSIYGENMRPKTIGVYTEDDLALPVSPYAIGKLTIENYLRYFKNKFGIDYIIYRISNPYGSNQSDKSLQGVIPIFINKIKNDEPLEIYGDGTMVRDYIHVSDVIRMMQLTFDKEHRFDVYNIGSGQGTTVNSLVQIIKKISNKNPKINYIPKPSTFVESVILSIDRFKNEFGVVPKITLKDGIENIINEK
jgi:UDP-glucose 4-epimerase